MLKLFFQVYQPNVDPDVMIKLVEILKESEKEKFEVIGEFSSRFLMDIEKLFHLCREPA